MKHILSIILVLFMLIGLFAVPASAKTIPAVVQEVTKEQLIWDDMYTLCEAVDSGDAANIFRTVLAVYPDLVVAIKKSMNDASANANHAVGTGDARYLFAVTELMNSPVFYDDLVKLANTVSSEEAEKIFHCILEIYPDFVAALKKALDAYDSNDEKVLCTSAATAKKTDGYSVVWVICAGVCGIAVGAIAAYVMMKKNRRPNRKNTGE